MESDRDYYGFVYITTNMINGKKYIGKRKYSTGWEKYLGSGKYLKNALKKYGKYNFKREILYNCTTEEELEEKEKYYIDLYDAVKSNNFYNIHEGGTGGNLRSGWTKEQLDEYWKKFSISLKGRYAGKNNPMWGKTHTKEVREKIAKCNSERIFTDEMRKKYSDVKKGKKHTEDHKKNIGKSKLKKVIVIQGHTYKVYDGAKYVNITTDIYNKAPGKRGHYHEKSKSWIIYLYLLEQYFLEGKFREEEWNNYFKDMDETLKELLER